MEQLEAVRWRGDHIEIVDQTLLPGRLEMVALRRVDDVVDALRSLAVRGAPAIGVCGAYGVVVGIDEAHAASASDAIAAANEAAVTIAAARPTAVNLSWAATRVAQAGRSGSAVAEVRDSALEAATWIHDRDRESCARIGEAGRVELATARSILTHCNTGWLATGGTGTALAVVYAKAEKGEPVEVFAAESRPLLQGARLTAWELKRAGIPVRLLVDAAAGALLASADVDAVIVGCDRIAANGDAANKVGTYNLATLAHANDVPFYVAGPMSSFDLEALDGSAIEIEQRHPDEVLRVRDMVIAPSVDVFNPAFDVTPSALVRAFITDVGVLRPPFEDAIGKAVAHAEELGLR